MTGNNATTANTPPPHTNNPHPHPHDDPYTNPTRTDPAVTVLGIQAPAPRFALTVIWTVMAGFLVMQTVDILGQAVTPITIACCLTVLPATIALQLLHILPRYHLQRTRYKTWTLLTQTALTVIPSLLLGWPWGGMGGFAGASLLTLLPLKTALPSFTTLILLIALDTAITTHNNPTAILYMTISTLITGIIIYSLTLLANLTLAIHQAQDDITRTTVIKERLRFARDLHDLLGYTLTAITLKSELAHALTNHNPNQTRSELESIIQLSRQALHDVREVARTYRTMTLLTELTSARTLLTTAGINTHLKVDTGPLTTHADTVLATVLREGITNILRHSKATHCTIQATTHNNTTTLHLTNNGLPTKHTTTQPTTDHPDNNHSGLSNLTTRLAALGGTLTTQIHADGTFHLTAHITTPAGSTNSSSAGSNDNNTRHTSTGNNTADAFEEGCRSCEGASLE
ncbi:histidine kinase [Kitasatospora sp. MAP5-34]|uniref:sensor histidine kinase n=1 Tax=Kitasatospora sp. MAP5-34 TaxID=3035102 RepID=UPI0024748475|nr:histidine kinase [Kitasatospora sp. MAP5-34]MDH6580678.1 two-component system sensor histidine kinase DesK [Kitasatospora sp. MAP5-34]